jgi:hypothetical protein
MDTGHCASGGVPFAKRALVVAPGQQRDAAEEYDGEDGQRGAGRW